MQNQFDDEDAVPWESEDQEMSELMRQANEAAGEVRAGRTEREQEMRVRLGRAGGTWASRVQRIVLGKSDQVQSLLKEALQYEENALREKKYAILHAASIGTDWSGQEQWESPLKRPYTFEWERDASGNVHMEIKVGKLLIGKAQLVNGIISSSKPNDEDSIENLLPAPLRRSDNRAMAETSTNAGPIADEFFLTLGAETDQPQDQIWGNPEVLEEIAGITRTQQTAMEGHNIQYKAFQPSPEEWTDNTNGNGHAPHSPRLRVETEEDHEGHI